MRLAPDQTDKRKLAVAMPLQKIDLAICSGFPITTVNETVTIIDPMTAYV